MKIGGYKVYIMVNSNSNIKQKLKEYVEKLTQSGQTNGKKGLKLAFDIFTESAADSKTSGCLRIISFLTDGNRWLIYEYIGIQ